MIDHTTKQRQALIALAENILRIASGGSAGDPYALFSQAVDYARAEIDAKEAGEDYLSADQIRSALQWEVPERKWSEMTCKQEEKALADQAVARMQKAALRISAYRISGSEGVQHYKAVNAFDDALRDYQQRMAAWRRM